MSEHAIRIKGNLQLPENLFSVILAVSPEEKRKEGLLKGFERVVDPVLIGVFFGLFKSQELPPIDEKEITLDKKYEFNVDISPQADLLNHYLFCLWIKEKGLPDLSQNIDKYREDLYDFISRLHDAEYYRSVLIPFYLRKADESESGEPSFLYRLWNSDDIGLVLQPHSPEYLALEFNSAKSEFMTKVTGAIERKSSKAGK